MPDAGTDDIQWLASLSKAQLSQHVANGFSVVFCGFPTRSPVAVDLRVYGSGLTIVRGVPSEPTVHVVSLLSVGLDSNGPPGAACASAFLSAPSGATVIVSFNDAESKLDVCVHSPSKNAERELCDDIVGLDTVGNPELRELCAVGQRGVAVFSKPHAESWSRVAGHVEVATLACVGGVKANHSVFVPDRSCDVGGEGDSAASNVANDVELFPQGSSLLRFERLPEMRRLKGMSPAEVTQFNMDRSAYVCWLVASRFNGRVSALLAEFQLAFLVFIVMRSLPGLAHWSTIVREVCDASDGLVTDAPEIIAAFSRILSAQFEFLEEDVLAAESDALQSAVLNVCCTAGELKNGIPEVRELADVVKRRYGWVPTG